MSSATLSIWSVGNEFLRLDKDTKQHKSLCINHGVQLTDIKLGCGTYSTVRLGIKISANVNINAKKVAIKIISKARAAQDGYKSFFINEVFNHRIASRHRNVVTLSDVFETNCHLYLILEYCPYGNLSDFINKYGKPGLRESQSRLMFSQLCQAITFCHENNIVHRDIKCENVLLDERCAVRLADFGYSCMVTDNQKDIGYFYGSVAYAAPEIIKGRPYNGKRADIWSLLGNIFDLGHSESRHSPSQQPMEITKSKNIRGIVLYCMVCGRLPFNLKNKTVLLQDMLYQRLRLTSLSSELVLLLRHILQYEMERRPSLKTILENTWTQGKRIQPGTSLHQSEEWVTPMIESILMRQCGRVEKRPKKNPFQFCSGTDLLQILTRRMNKRMRNKVQCKAVPSMSHTSEESAPRTYGMKHSTVVVGDTSGAEAILLKSRLPKRRDVPDSPSESLLHGPQQYGEWQQQRGNQPEEYDDSEDSCSRPHQNTPEDEMSNGENEQGDHQREADVRPRFCQCCVACYKDRIKQCLRTLQSHFEKFPDMDDPTALELLTRFWNQDANFGIMTVDQASLILAAWKQSLLKEKAVPVLKFTKKNKTLGATGARHNVTVPSSGVSVHSMESDYTVYTTSTKVTLQSEKMPLDDVLLIKNVFGNGVGVPCNKKPAEDKVTKKSAAESNASTCQTQGQRASSYITKWEIRPRKHTVPSNQKYAPRYGNQVKYQKKLNLKPVVKQLLSTGDFRSSEVASSHTTRPTKFPTESKPVMTTFDLIAALGMSYPRKPKMIDINIRPWKP